MFHSEIHENHIKRLFSIKLSRILQIIVFLMIFNLFIFRPVSKYFEYSWNILRINITFISLLLLILFIFFFLIYLIKSNFIIKRNLPIIITSLLLIYLILIQIISYPYLEKYSDIFLKTISNTIIHYSILFISGIYAISLLRKNIVKKGIIISWFILTFIFIFFSLNNKRGFFLILNEAPIYLMLADSFAILAIITISLLKKQITQISVFTISIIILFILYSRATLYSFIFIFFIYLFYKNKKILFSLIIFSIIMFSQLNIYDSLKISKQDRMFRLLYGIKDTSQSERKIMFSEGVESIKKNWLTGNFLGEVVKHKGKPGHYIHNYLSFLRQFGIIPFVIFVSLVLYLYLRILLLIVIKKDDRYFNFVFLYFTFVLLEIIVARSYTSPYIWFAISSSAVYLRFYEKSKTVKI